MKYFNIIETELKFELRQKQDGIGIFNFFKDNYVVRPFDNTAIVDYYYDIDDLFYNTDFTYRIRRKNSSKTINFKLPGSRNHGLVSRCEYRYKLKDIKKDNAFLLKHKNPVNDIVKKQFGIPDLLQLENVLTLYNRRICFNVYTKERNPIGDNTFIGTLYFDEIFNCATTCPIYECEFETCNSLMTLDGFQDVVSAGANLNSLGFIFSDKSKYSRMRNIEVAYEEK